MQQQAPNTRHVIKKRKIQAFTLIEVLVAFALLALCIVPLLYPHFSILKEEIHAAREIEADRLASKLYGKLLERLYQNDVYWSELQKHEWQSQDIPKEHDFFSLYRLKVVEAKPVDNPKHLLVECTMLFVPKEKRQREPDIAQILEESKQGWSYTFTFYAERKRAGEEELPEKSDQGDKNES